MRAELLIIKLLLKLLKLLKLLRCVELGALLGYRPSAEARPSGQARRMPAARSELLARAVALLRSGSLEHLKFRFIAFFKILPAIFHSARPRGRHPTGFGHRAP